jgi:hypothetical protein
MASRGDDWGEMTTAANDTAAEEAFEAYLAGRPVAAEGAGVASFAAAVRATATEPGRPNAALAELLTTGLLVDQPTPSPRTAPTRRRRRLAMFFPALLAKLLSAGAIAQAATGAGVAVVVVCSAGAVGALPDPVQETFSSIVGTETEQPETVEPAPVDDGTVDPAPVDGGTVDPAPVGDTTAPEDTGTEGSGDEYTGPPLDVPFGQWKKEQGDLGEVPGQRVSEWAHQRNEHRRNQGAEDSGNAEDGDSSGDDGSTEAGDDRTSGGDTSGGDTSGEASTQDGGGRGHGRHGDR